MHPTVVKICESENEFTSVDVASQQGDRQACHL
jgi:hypothetical protein